MENMIVWQNSQVPLTVNQGDPESVSATLVMILQDGSVDLTITKTASFVDVDGVMTADLTLNAADTATEGLYDYYIKENFDDEDSLIYPNPDNCEDECELPTIKICPLEDGDVS